MALTYLRSYESGQEWSCVLGASSLSALPQEDRRFNENAELAMYCVPAHLGFTLQTTSSTFAALAA